MQSRKMNAMEGKFGKRKQRKMRRRHAAYFKKPSN